MCIFKLLTFTFFLSLTLTAATAQTQDAGIAQGQATVQAQAALVLVDITATDDKHNPIHQLTAADFTILEDGHPQTVKVFEEHAAGAPAAFPAMPKLHPGAFTNYSPAPARGALNILLFDKLNTPLTAQSYVRDQVLKYLKEAPSGTRIAIFALTTDLKMLQGFTSDPELLRSMVEGKKNSLNSSVLMNNAVDGDNPGDDNAELTAASNLADAGVPDAATIMANLQQFEAEQQSFQWRLRVIYTLDALNDLARYMSNLPGRKNLIWFSGSFPINILPDGDLQNPFSVVDSADGEFRQTVDLLSRGQVAVYPIDARGLMVQPMFNASSSGSSFGRNPRAFGNAETKWSQKTAGEHDTMKQMAEETGGRAFVNTNGLTESVATAIEAGSNYYSVAYSPANVNWNGGFRRIQVKIDKPGVTLAYRRGYYADDPNKPTQGKPTQGMATQSVQAQSGQGQNGQPAAPPFNAMRQAMMHGAPDPTQIVFVADVRPATTDNETAAIESNKLAKNAQGPFRRYTITYAINPSQVNFAAGQDGAHKCGLEFVTLVYDADGALVNEQANGVALSISDAKFADSMKRDFVYRQQISVPVKGEYYFRIGMRDRNTDNVGALEVPVTVVAKLQPATGTAATPAGGSGAKPN
jgi:VWFA-related protein